jgi:hypothetical protein
MRKSMKTGRGVLATSLLLMSMSGQAQAGFTATAGASVNLISNPAMQKTDVAYTGVSNSASGDGRTALSTAGWDTIVGASTDSSGGALTNEASAAASFSSSFTVVGNTSGDPLPLTYHVHLEGILEASTSSVPPLVNYGSVANANFLLNVYGLTNHTFRSLTLTSQGGSQTITDASGSNPYFGNVVEIHSTIQLADQVTTLGYFSVALSSVASSSPIGSTFARSGFIDTAYLESITVPADFNTVDISGLSIVFDSGLTMPVTRAVAAVPEPSCVVLTGLGLVLLSARVLQPKRFGCR